MARTAAEIEQQIEQLWQRWHRNPNAKNADALLSRIDYEQGELVLQREHEAAGSPGKAARDVYLAQVEEAQRGLAPRAWGKR